MGVVKDIGKMLVSPIAAVLGAGTPKPPQPLPQPTTDQAAKAAAEQDQLSKRRGPLADMLMGAAGAESTTGAAKKTSLGA